MKNSMNNFNEQMIEWKKTHAMPDTNKEEISNIFKKLLKMN